MMKTLKDVFYDLLNESAISNKDFKRAQDLIANYLKKYKIYVMPDINGVNVEGTKYYGSFVFDAKTNLCAYFLWKQASDTKLDGIIFSDSAAFALNAISNGDKFPSSVSVTLSGCSLARLLPFVKDVLNGKIAMEARTIKRYLVDQIVYDEIDKKFVDESFVVEGESAEVIALKKRKATLFSRIAYNKKKGKDVDDLQKEVDEINDKLADLQVSVRRGGNVTVDVEEDPAEKEFEERATPEERFIDMENYIKMVIKGIQPSLLISGAPGVGKSFRVMQAVKQGHTMGENLYLIKGKCTAMALYTTLFDFRHKGDIIVFDDADSIVEDDTAINLLKAATDSSDERWVSYGTSRPPKMSEDQYEMLDPEDQALCTMEEMRGGAIQYFYPKSFMYEGSIIIVTNKSAGSVDTAIRNRALICDLEFTTEEILGIVKDLMPVIGADYLSMDVKMKALNYLQEMANQGSKMDISLRSFKTVAKVYAACGDDDKSAQRMIREQMKLQALRDKKHY